MRRIALESSHRLRASLLAPLLALPLVLGGLAPIGCQRLNQGCTEMGCSDGLSVAFAHTTWNPGHYRFELSLDGKKVTCEVDLPLPEAPESACTDDQVLLGLSGSALPDSEHEITGFDTVGLHPKAVKIVAWLDDNELGSSEFAPEYERVAPNGEECGPICEQGKASFKF